MHSIAYFHEFEGLAPLFSDLITRLFVYSWHATQEYRWSNEGTPKVLAIVAVAVTVCRYSSFPPRIGGAVGLVRGAGSSGHVLLDAF